MAGIGPAGAPGSRCLPIRIDISTERDPAPAAGGVHGAVYELRDREITLTENNIKEVTDVLATLFAAT